MAKVVPLSRRLTAPEFVGDAALLYVFPTNAITLTTEELVGLFQALTLEPEPKDVTIDFFLSDPTPYMPTPDLVYDGSAWVSGVLLTDRWCAYTDAGRAFAARRMLEALHQFTIPTGVNLIGLSDDWVHLEDFKWVAIRVAYATNPTADVYVQITPQTQPPARPGGST